MKKYTYLAKNADNQGKWFIVDADGMVLGRLATVVAARLRGKHNPMYTPHADTGDAVVVINADKIVLTGRKMEQKKYYRHSGYIGGLTEITADKLLEKRPEDLVRFAVSYVPFYQTYYQSKGFAVDDLKSFDDIARIPIIDKAVLQQAELERRSAPASGRYRVNTGGSSGSTLSLYVHPRQMGNEWAHMHTIWDVLKYRPHHLKLMFGGRSDIQERTA